MNLPPPPELPPEDADAQKLRDWINAHHDWILLLYEFLKFPVFPGGLNVGDATNYCGIENDGTIEFNGTATVWKDQQVTIGQTKFAGVSDPTWIAYKGGRVLAFAKAADNILYFTVQLQHDYKANSNLEFHIHTVHPDTGAGNSIWHFTHSWADIGSDFPAETTVNKTIASPVDADKHQLNSFSSTISGAGAGVSSFLLCSLQREGTDGADTYDDVIYVVGIDFHYEVDTVGSRQIATK